MADTNPKNEEKQPAEGKPTASESTPKPDPAAPKPEGGESASEKPAPAAVAKSAASAGAKPAPAAGAKPAAPGAKPAAAKPAAKPKVEKKPLIDNGDGTITDPNSGLMWKKTDAWIDTKKFYTWPQAPEYVDKVNKEKFAGHDDWRIPSKAEAATLVDKTKKHMDKNGTEYPFDPIFEIGCAAVTWITECTEEKVVRFDYKIGSEFTYPPCELWSSIRVVRNAEGYEDVPKPGAAPAAKPAPKPGAPAAGVKPAAPAAGAAKPAAPAGDKSATPAPKPDAPAGEKAAPPPAADKPKPTEGQSTPTA
ncbi:hypothetical protein LQ236_002668 [Nitrospina gracilis]|uniref:Lcl C-terminal domain-containing protein n=1 Tax=Nitrospina sp. Nb-3 TaxID=2940485 RepID=UPI001F2F9A9B|nr:DUF1566 domain-containing protein [Nitrospina sp. Nb-3]MCF8724648.1 hypothetical protein [Nitrospina sp. Nb-3]